jgi:hypothetical protein
MNGPAGFAALLALAAACSCAPRGDDHGRPLQHRGGAVPALAPPPDALSYCVTACVRDRQMEATSIAHIRSGCARTCALPPPIGVP